MLHQPIGYYLTVSSAERGQPAGVSRGRAPLTQAAGLSPDRIPDTPPGTRTGKPALGTPDHSGQPGTGLAPFPEADAPQRWGPDPVTARLSESSAFPVGLPSWTAARSCSDQEPTGNTVT